MVSFSRSRVSASNPHQLVLWTLLAGILTYIIALIFLRNQLRPIKRLSQAAEAFGRGQVVPMNPAGATEVRAAGIAFLSMRSRLARHTEQRTQMLSAVSHDLRTPLTRLKLGLEMISEDTTDLQRDVQDMDQMIEGFLNFARDGTEETTRSVDLTDLVRSVIEDHKRAGDPISVGMLDETGPVSLRPNLMRRAIKNLISNAVRYGERALVSLTVLDTSVRIRVEDSGPGIPETMRSEAILPFNRLDAARNQDKGGGVGLGLAIVADVARLHGGVVRLSDSQELGGLSADIVLSRD